MPLSTLKRKLIGTPLRTTEALHERLSKFAALAVFSSDALSSVAYATEEILLALILAGSAGLPWSWPISVAIALLLLIVATSYRQTIHAYPSGGGAYIVAKENLGVYPGLVAAAALLIDYVLTVSVSVAAGALAVSGYALGVSPTVLPPGNYWLLLIGSSITSNNGKMGTWTPYTFGTAVTGMRVATGFSSSQAVGDQIVIDYTTFSSTSHALMVGGVMGQVLGIGSNF